MYDSSNTLIFQHLIDRVVLKSMLLGWRNEKIANYYARHGHQKKKEISAMPDVSG